MIAQHSGNEVQHTGTQGVSALRATRAARHGSIPYTGYVQRRQFGVPLQFGRVRINFGTVLVCQEAAGSRYGLPFRWVSEMKNETERDGYKRDARPACSQRAKRV